MSIINHYRKPKINYRASLIIFLCVISCNALGVSLAAKQKYPFTLLTDDYGILNDHDLSFYLSYIHTAPHFPKTVGEGYIYWQCFPRENVSITLEDYGYFEEDLGRKDTIGNIEIRAMIKPGVFHEYCIRKVWTTQYFQGVFNQWRKLMAKQKYVCLAGDFISRQEIVENGTKRDVSGWFFERLKTKNGCVSYFDGSC